MAAEEVPSGFHDETAVVPLSGDVGTKYRAAADVVQKVCGQQHERLAAAVHLVSAPAAHGALLSL